MTGTQIVVAIALALIVALLLFADRQVAEQARQYAWRSFSLTLVNGRERELTVRTKRDPSLGLTSVLVLDRLDVSPLAANSREACVYCLGRVTHSDALCAYAQDWILVRKLDPASRAWWISAGHRLRATLLAASSLEGGA